MKAKKQSKESLEDTIVLSKLGFWMNFILLICGFFWMLPLGISGLTAYLIVSSWFFTGCLFMFTAWQAAELKLEIRGKNGNKKSD